MYSPILLSISCVIPVLGSVVVSPSCASSRLSTSRNESGIQSRTCETALDTDGFLSFLKPRDLEYAGAAYIKQSSSAGGESAKQPVGKNPNPTEAKKDEDEGKEGGEEAADSSEEDEFELDESGCPILSKNFFLCSMCGGKDADGKCKGDPDDNNKYAGCSCTDDPDWSKQPPPLVRPHYREHQRAIRDRHLLNDDGDVVLDPANVTSAATATAAAAAAVVVISTQLPAVTMSAIACFGSNQ